MRVGGKKQGSTMIGQTTPIHHGTRSRSRRSPGQRTQLGGGVHPPPQILCQYSASGCSPSVNEQSGGSGVYACGNSTPKNPGHSLARVNRTRNRDGNSSTTAAGEGLEEDREGSKKRLGAEEAGCRALASWEASRPGLTRASRTSSSTSSFSLPRQLLPRLISSS